MSFALPSRWRSGHIRADSQERIPVGLFRTNLERWISTGSSHRVLVKDGKHAVAKTQYLGRASAIHARTGIAERSDAFRGLWARKGLARRSSTDESSLEELSALQEGPKNALPDGTRYEYDPILKRTVEVTPSGERFPVTLVDGKLQRDSQKAD